MAVFKYHITKRRTWRGHEEEWENVYTYMVASPVETEAGHIDMLNQIKEIERIVHGSSVTFVQGRAHGPIVYNGTPPVKDKEADIMRAVVDWNDIGLRTTGANIAPELAAVVSVLIGRSARGYKQILKKFWHVDILTGAVNGDAASRGIGQLPSSAKDLYAAQYADLRELTVGVSSNVLCNDFGKMAGVGTTFVCQPYLHTRQFKRGRKERP